MSDQQENDTSDISQTDSKYDLFILALSHLDPHIKNGYGFTVTEIKEFILSLAQHDNMQIYNRDVKKFVLDHYGDNIRFCPSHRVYEPEMCFS